MLDLEFGTGADRMHWKYPDTISGLIFFNRVYLNFHQARKQVTGERFISEVTVYLRFFEVIDLIDVDDVLGKKRFVVISR